MFDGLIYYINNFFQFYSIKDRQFISPRLEMIQKLFGGIDGFARCKTRKQYQDTYIFLVNYREENENGE